MKLWVFKNFWRFKTSVPREPRRSVRVNGGSDVVVGVTVGVVVVVL